MNVIQKRFSTENTRSMRLHVRTYIKATYTFLLSGGKWCNLHFCHISHGLLKVNFIWPHWGGIPDAEQFIQEVAVQNRVRFQRRARN